MTTMILANGLQVRIAPCRNCNRLLPVAALGRCRGCYQHYHRYGSDRPLESIKPGHPAAASRRHCDCGQPANHEKIVKIGRFPHLKQTTLYLCDDCLKLEKQK